MLGTLTERCITLAGSFDVEALIELLGVLGMHPSRRFSARGLLVVPWSSSPEMTTMSLLLTCCRSRQRYSAAPDVQTVRVSSCLHGREKARI